MAYPQDKPTGEYALREYNFGTNDTNKLPIDEYLFKNGYKNADESTVESVPDAHNVNWLYDVLYRNLRYTQQVAEENKTQLSTKLATPTSIGQVKIGYGLEITSNGVLSVSKQVAEDANIISYDLPVGSYMLWAGKNTPEYFIEPIGQELLKTAYPELWEFAQSNDLIGKLFEEGSDDTSFVVKDIRGNFISIADSDDKVGKFTEAGLPNITGTITSGSYFDTGSATMSGAFSKYDGSAPTTRSYIDSTVQSGINFNASWSNAIYGKSNTVVPANYGLKIILKALPTPPSNAVPTGTILTYTGLTAPDGYIIANGAELSRTTFSNLFNWATANGLILPQDKIPSTAHSYYGDGDGSTTFTIPDVRGVFTRWADLASNRGGAEARTYQQDGAPNITGTISNMIGQTSDSSGEALSHTGSGRFSFAQNGGAAWQSVTLNASLSNAVYGRSNQVQPKSVSQIPLLKY